MTARLDRETLRRAASPLNTTTWDDYHRAMATEVLELREERDRLAAERDTYKADRDAHQRDAINRGLRADRLATALAHHHPPTGVIRCEFCQASLDAALTPAPAPAVHATADDSNWAARLALIHEHIPVRDVCEQALDEIERIIKR